LAPVRTQEPDHHRGRCPTARVSRGSRWGGDGRSPPDRRRGRHVLRAGPC